MLILIPGSAPISSYVVARAFEREPITIFTEQHEYIHAKRLMKRLIEENRKVKIVQCSLRNAAGHVEIENPLIHFNELSPFAACVLQDVQAKGEYHLITIDDEGEITFEGTTAVPSPQISLEAMLELRGIKGEFSIDVQRPELATALALEYDSEEKAIDLIRWINGKLEHPPFEALKAIPIEDRQWVKRGWLREYIFSLLNSQYAYHSIQFSDGEISIDVALIQAHRLIAFACEPRPYKDECIARALAVHSAAKRLAGDFARTVLVCGSKYPEDIRDRLANIVGRYEIEVIGIRSIPRLCDEFPVKKLPLDVETVREKRWLDSLYGRRQRADHW